MLDQRLAGLNGEWRHVARAVEFVDYIRSRVGERRYQHSISVTQVLYLIAQDLDLDPRLAVTAGLLHDSCKSFKNDAMLAEALRLGIPISDLQRARPSLLHGHVAAELCNAELGVDEPDVHEAISWHVTGRAGLGLLGKALFFADFSEPLRSHPSSARARDIFDKLGFDAALRFAAEAKLRYLESKGLLIDPEARAFHAWLVADALP